MSLNSVFVCEGGGNRKKLLLFFFNILARMKKFYIFVKNQITDIMKKKSFTNNYKPSSDSGYSYGYYADKYASSSYVTYGVSYDFLTAEQKAKLR